MPKALEKTLKTSALDRLEARLMKLPGYRKVHAKNALVTKVATRLIRFRQAKSLTQTALAQNAGISRKALNEIEGLVNDNPNLKTLEALAKAMAIPVARLLDEASNS